MSNLRRLVVTLCLISILTVTALAGEIQTPPCAPLDPGEIQTPPCSTAQLTADDPTNPVEIDSPPSADVVVIDTIINGAVGAFLSIW